MPHSPEYTRGFNDAMSSKVFDPSWRTEPEMMDITPISENAFNKLSATPSDEITIEYEVTETATYRKSMTVTAEVAADPELLADAMAFDWNHQGDTQAHFIEVIERDYARATD